MAAGLGIDELRTYSDLTTASRRKVQKALVAKAIAKATAEVEPLFRAVAKEREEAPKAAGT
jgi:hypothetical protein